MRRPVLYHAASACAILWKGLEAAEIAASCSAEALQAALPSDATVLVAQQVPQGGSFGEGAADIPYPTNPTNLPETCAVIVNVTTSESSSFRFGMFLPTEWNGRFLQVGNGGFAGGINFLDVSTFCIGSVLTPWALCRRPAVARLCRPRPPSPNLICM